MTARRHRRNGPGDDGAITCVDGKPDVCADDRRARAVPVGARHRQPVAGGGAARDQPAGGQRPIARPRAAARCAAHRAQLGRVDADGGRAQRRHAGRRGRRGDGPARRQRGRAPRRRRAAAASSPASPSPSTSCRAGSRRSTAAIRRSGPSCGSPTRRSWRTRCAPAVPTSASWRGHNRRPTCTPWRSPPTTSSSSSRPTTRGPAAADRCRWRRWRRPRSSCARPVPGPRESLDQLLGQQGIAAVPPAMELRVDGRRQGRRARRQRPRRPQSARRRR